MHLDPNVSHHESILNGHEKSQYDFIKSQATSDTLFFDIGANVGYYSLSLAPYVNQVVAVEPTPDVSRILEKNVEENDFNNVKIEEKGVYDQPGEMSLHRHAGTGQAMNSLAPSVRLKGDSVEVPITTVDSLAEEHGHPDLVKMDVEGAEAHAIKGMSSVLNKGTKLIMEVHGNSDPQNNKLSNHGTTPEELFQLISTSGYKVRDIRKEEDIDSTEEITKMPSTWYAEPTFDY